MKKNIIKYLSISAAIITFFIFYFSLIGIETDRFNNQIKDKISENNKDLELELKKIKLITD